jgi:hypothetical protein
MASRKIPLRNILKRACDFHALRPVGQSSTAVRAYSAVPQDRNGPAYVSPFQEIFDTIKEGKTFLGSTEFKIPEVKFLECGVPEHALRFKTTTYGRLLEEPYVRPMEHRITLQVPISYIPLNEVEEMALKEIVGTRLNEGTGMLHLSSAQFGSRIENKRHVVSMLDRIVESTKALAAKVEVDIGGGKAVEA